MERVEFIKGRHFVVDGDLYDVTRRRKPADVVWARGTAVVSAFGLHEAYVWDTATLRADCCRNVRASDQSSVESRGWGLVYASGQARVVAKDDTVVFAYGDAEITAYGRTVIVLEAPEDGISNVKLTVCSPRVLVIDRRGRGSKPLTVSIDRRGDHAC